MEIERDGNTSRLLEEGRATAPSTEELELHDLRNGPGDSFATLTSQDKDEGKKESLLSKFWRAVRRYCREDYIHRQTRDPKIAKSFLAAAPIYLKASASYEEYDTTDNVADLDAALSCYEELASLEDYEDSLIFLSSLRQYASALYRRSEEAQDSFEDQKRFLAKSLSILRQIRAHSKADLDDLDDHIRVARHHYNLASDAESLDECIALYRASVEARTFDSTRRIHHLDQLIFLLTRRSHASALQQQDDLREVVERCRHYLASSEAAAKFKPRDSFFVSAHLAFALMSLDYDRHSFPLDEAIDVCDKIVMSSSPDNNAYYPQTLYLLAYGLYERYILTGNDVDCTRAAFLLKQYIPLLPPDPRDRIFAMRRYGQALYSSFIRDGQGDAQDINTAIDKLQDTLTICHSMDDRLAVLQELAECLHAQYLRYREQPSLERASELFKEVLELASDADTRVSVLNDLGVVMFDAAEVSGRQGDLDHAVRCFLEASQVSSADANLNFCLLMNLGMALYLLAFSYNLPHIEESIDCLRRAATIDANHQESWRLSHNLASILSQYSSKHSDPLLALQEAAVFHEKALSLQNSDVYRPTLLNQLGVTLRRRYGRTTNLAHLDDALQKHESALALSPLGISDHSRTLYLQSLALFTRYLHASDHDAFKRAMGKFSLAATDPYTPAHVRYLYANTWIKASVQGSESDSSTSAAYALAISLLPQMAYYGLDINARLRYLSQAAGIACDAAEHTLAISDSARSSNTAIELLEEGRSVFWRQALRSRNPVEEGLGVDADIAKRLLEVSGQLENDTYATKVQPVQVVVEQRHGLAFEFENLLKEVRRQRGLENFLLPVPYDNISLAARDGPVVVLVPGKADSYAVLIRSASANAEKVVLQGLSLTKILNWVRVLDGMNSMYRSQGRDQRAGGPVFLKGRDSPEVRYHRVLKDLWMTLVKPVLSQLELQRYATTSLDKRPRLWWCPTGAFSFIPIHAAGLYDPMEPLENTSDYVVSSYTPTVTTLINARVGLPVQEPRTLLIAQPVTQGFARLPNTVDEVKTITTLVPSHLVLHIREGPGSIVDLNQNCCHSDVVKQLPDASIVHFACHGSQHLDKPLESGFHLTDDTLTVASLMQLKIRRPLFAFLSACQSASGDIHVPDETVHLAATMLFCGFKSVVGTMWSMNDLDGPVVAREVYTGLFSDYPAAPDPFRIPRAVDSAIRKLRASGAPPSRWATWIHMGI